MTAASATPSVWEDATLLCALFAIDPVGLAGVSVRTGPGPARDRWLALLRLSFAPDAPMRRAPLYIDDDRMLGGLDLAASLASGRPVALRGVLAECDGGVIVLPMAERIEAAAAARLTAALDQGEIAVERDGLAVRLPARLGVIALDEGLDPEERPPAALIDRLAFHIDLGALRERDSRDGGLDPARIAAARQALSSVEPAADGVVEALCAAADMMGVGSARGPLLALRAARAHAALSGRTEISAEDAALAARLVLAPRATIAPAFADDTATPEELPPPSEPPDIDKSTNTDEARSRPEDSLPVELVLEAIQAALPEDLLERIRLEGALRQRSSGSRGAGQSAKSARRGRPAGSRQGALRPGDRLNLVETLRAATPWQKLRGRGADVDRVLVRQEDFRVRRFKRRAESTTIFVVDSSGSAAFQRLGEAKGAVELLLAKAYVTRARVALVAFRGFAAEVLLPPTRSLTRAKRQLAALPGGGGTPLAAGIDAALTLALSERAQDRTPMLVFLTDGRANVGRDGRPGRREAEAEAAISAERVRATGVATAWLDTASRPRPDSDRFARAMGALYAPLPYANAGAVFDVVDALRSSPR